VPERESIAIRMAISQQPMVRYTDQAAHLLVGISAFPACVGAFLASLVQWASPEEMYAQDAPERGASQQETSRAPQRKIKTFAAPWLERLHFRA